MEIADFIIEPESTILSAMKKIDQNARGIVYICNDKKLLGVLTDGDIRRFILKNGDLKRSVIDIANREPRYLRCENKKDAKTVMDKFCINSLPILDLEEKVTEICFRYERVKGQKMQLNIPVVIMAGGKGTRLYPYTQILPKPLIPIGEQTITEHIMDRFSAYGCTRFDMIINYKKNFIKAYFMDNENHRDISFIEEKEFLGTGGGLRLLEGRYASTFFMSNCDILIEADYGDILKFHKEQGNIATMVCAMKHVMIPYGTVEASEKGQAVRLNEKPELSFITNTGMYILEPEFIEMIPKNTFIHITDVIQNCIDDGKKVGVFPIAEENWLDMGQLDELERMKAHLMMPGTAGEV